MAKVQAQITGGQIKSVEASTVREVKDQLGVPTYTAQVNGEPAEDSQGLNDYEFVSLTEAVKGGR